MDSFKDPAETVTTGRELRKQNKLIKIKKEESHRRGNRNSIFRELNEEDKEKYLFLFATKDNYTSNEYKEFWSLFPEFAKLQTEKDKTYDFSFIIFPKDSENILKEGDLYNYEVNFSNCIFNSTLDFSDVKFLKPINFTQSTFKENVDFSYCTFKDKANFSKVIFESDTYFAYCAFFDVINFENSECKGIFDFSDVAFSSLLLDKSSFPHASYLRLDGWNENTHEDIARERLSAKHFQTKETARIIKAHFEKQNNITESNVYYPIEMDKYREELANHTNPFMAFFTNQNYFVTTLSKYISNYGTSWFRAGIVIMLFSFLASLIYSFIFDPGSILAQYLTDKENGLYFNPNVQLYLQAFLCFWSGIYLLNLFSDTEITNKIPHKYKVILYILFSLLIVGASILFFLFYLNQNKIAFDNIIETHNYIARVVNPFGAFKANDIFKNYESLGTIVRLIMLTLMYQFLVAFRQNTRRK